MSKVPPERPTLLSFREGVDTLTRALHQKLGNAVRLGTEVVGVRRAASNGPFELKIRASGRSDTILTDCLVVATSTDAAGKILGEVNADYQRLLSGIEYAPMAIVAMGYQCASVGNSLDGFGFLVPRSAKLRTLGTVWNSSLFPGRAPQGHVLLTSFVGGATDREVVTLSTDELISLVHKEIAPLLAIRETPSFSQVTVYSKALPQYNVGHSDRLASLEKLRDATPGLWLAGNYLRGPSVGACVDESLAVAQDVLSHLRR
jgi:oxygen-dependent protoporphyrinogen oxidase